MIVTEFELRRPLADTRIVRSLLGGVPLGSLNFTELLTPGAVDIVLMEVMGQYRVTLDPDELYVTDTTGNDV
jgi:hypothetical protein